MNRPDVVPLQPTPGFVDTRNATTRKYCAHPFQPGNPSGNARKRRQPEKYYRKFCETFGLEEFTKVVRKLFEMALEGDVKAAKLLIDKALPDGRIEDFIKALGDSGAAAAQIVIVTKDELEQRKEALRAKVVG